MAKTDNFQPIVKIQARGKFSTGLKFQRYTVLFVRTIKGWNILWSKL